MTPTGLMRSLLPSSLLLRRSAGPTTSRLSHCDTLPKCPTPSTCRCYAQPQTSLQPLNQILSFQSTPTFLTDNPPSPRTLQLGKTIRTLHDRLPTLLLSPLPSEILSPSISLHLFPSTHPHLPAVSGRIAYVAALWTAPVAWGRVPLVGNVRLEILNEKMIKSSHYSSCSSSPSYGPAPPADEPGDEKLIVKWRTQCRRNTPTTSSSPPLSSPSTSKEEGEDPFEGIFLFEFDSQGKILKHIIEHTEENGHGLDPARRAARVVSVTDWLLGRIAKKGGEEGVPGLAFCAAVEEAGERRKKGG